MSKRVIGGLVAPLLLTACGSPDTVSENAGNDAQVGWPTEVVSASGDISMPADFLDWPTLGAWSTADDAGIANGMHQVYVTPGAAASYRENGVFPDGTVLVKEVLSAATAQLTTGAASYATDKGVWFVMIKDASARHSDNPLWGDGWGWALFEAKEPLKQVATDYKQDCLECHIPAQGTDWIYVEAYPVLWPEGKPPVAKWLAEAETAAGGDAKEAEDAPKQAAVVPDQFNRCAACHSATPGRNGVAPSLAGIVGRKAGTEAGYKYSAAMKNSGVTWTVANLDRHIEDASLVVPGNKMVTLFPKGVTDKKDRDAIIAYLETL